MSKASEQELAALHGAVARKLAEIIRGPEDPEAAPAPAAYFAAALAMLKQNNITADASKNEELDDLSRALQEKRKQNKGKLSDRNLDEARAQLERDLGGFMQ